jgi:carbonic anhydrase/acetyltransferase-like protein (isoleucine patch superfamily)
MVHARHFKQFDLSSVIYEGCRINGAESIVIGKCVSIQKHSWLYAKSVDPTPADLEFGEGCVIGDFNHIACVRKVVFGKNVLTANHVYVSDNLHAYEDVTKPIMHQPVRFKGEVHIGDGTWIGENACVIGAKIGRNCVIGANAVVTGDIPDFSVAAGVPARVIKRYNGQTKCWEKVIDARSVRE